MLKVPKCSQTLNRREAIHLNKDTILFLDVLPKSNLRKKNCFKHFLSLNILCVSYVLLWQQSGFMRFANDSILFLFTFCTDSRLFPSWGCRRWKSKSENWRLCICNLSNDQKSLVPLVTKRRPVVYNETMRKQLWSSLLCDLGKWFPDNVRGLR